MATAEEILQTMAEVPESAPVCVIDPETRTIIVPPEYQLFGVENDKRTERLYFQCPKIVGDNQDLSRDYQLFINYQNANGDPDAYHIEDMEVDGGNITFSWLLEENVTKYRGNIQFAFGAIIPGDETEDPDKNRWNTTINTDCTCLVGLKCTQQVAESNPDALVQIWAAIDELKAGGGGGTGGTTNYNNLSNKPKLNGVTLEGNKTLDQVGVLAKNQGASNSGKYLFVGSDGNVVPADAPSGGTVDPEQIKQAVNGYLEENPVSGMTAEQEQQLNQNTEDVSDLKSAMSNKTLPPGGTTGQVLAKKSDADYDVEWKDESVTSTGDSILDLKDYSQESTQSGKKYLTDFLETKQGQTRYSDLVVVLTSSSKYKTVSLDYVDGMTVSTRSQHAPNTPDYPAIFLIKDGEKEQISDFETPEDYIYKATLKEDLQSAKVVVNMYDSSGTFSNKENYWVEYPEQQSVIKRPAYENEYIPTLDDKNEYDYKTYSSKKINSLVYRFAERPENGVEHFKIKVNKYNQTFDNTTSLQDGIEEIEDNGVVFIPETYSVKGNPTRLIISCHGSGTVIDDNFTQTSKTWNDFFVKMGYAVMDVNGCIADSRHFGAPFAIQSYIKGYQYVIGKYNLYEDVFILGASMGGLPSFTLAQNKLIPTIALAGFCPVVDLYRQAWMNPWYGGSSGEQWGEQRKLIAQYFNFDNYSSFENWTNTKTPSEEEMQYFIDNKDKWQGYNPMTCMCINSEQIFNTKTSNYKTDYDKLIRVCRIPFKIWQAETDPTVLSSFGKYIVSASKQSGGISYHRSYPSGGHTPGWGDEVEVTDLKDETIQVYTNEYECYLWFKRFD